VGVDPDTQLQRQLDWEKKKLRATQGAAGAMAPQAANTQAGEASVGPPQPSAQQLTTATPSQ
jgi:hypothetical protein